MGADTESVPLRSCGLPTSFWCGPEPAFRQMAWSLKALPMLTSPEYLGDDSFRTMHRAPFFDPNRLRSSS
jgi:hypothetical protein